MGRSHKRNVVSKIGGELGQAQGFKGGLGSGSRNQDLMRRAKFPRRLQHLAPLFIGEHDRFARGAENHDARYRSLRIAVHVVFEFSGTRVRRDKKA